VKRYGQLIGHNVADMYQVSIAAVLYDVFVVKHTLDMLKIIETNN